jgi:hypothetical protein
MNKSATLP